MESKVKSELSSITYTTQLEKLEEEDKELKSELYIISVSGHDILVSPGKSIMNDSGIAYCYVYAIKQNKVVCKLGIYEKKTDTMPMIFDLSTFPEDSLRLLDEYEKNPSRLKELEYTNANSSNTIFDYLINTLFPKIQDKKKKMGDTYKLVYTLYMKNKQDKEMVPILKVLSAARKTDPDDSFLQTLKELSTGERKTVDKRMFCLTLIALEPFFSVKFNVIYVPDDDKANNFVGYTTFEEWKRLKERWVYDFNPDKIIDVSVDTHEMLGERDNILSVIPEESSANLSKNVTSDETVEYKQETESEQTESEQKEYEEPAEEKEGSEYEIQIDPDEPVQDTEPEPESDPITAPEPMTRPKPKRTGTGKTPKLTRQGTSLNTVFESKPTQKSVPSGPSLSLNDVEYTQPSLSLNTPEIETPENSKKSTTRKSKPKRKSPSKNAPESNSGTGNDSGLKSNGKLKMKGIPSVKSKGTGK